MGEQPDRLEQLDYYTLLGLPQDASADKIREAFHTFALKFHPDRHAGGEEAKISRAEHIFRRGAEAYRVLLDPEARRVYDEGLAKGQIRLDPEVAAAASGSMRPGGGGRRTSGILQVKSIKARPFVKKAEQAMKKEDWKTAQLNLKIALQHEPDSELLEVKLASVQAKLDAKKRK